MRSLSRKEIENEMSGRWGSFFREMAPELADVFEGFPKQLPCPFTGGKTVFRSMKDRNITGGFYHNKDGPMKTGITAYAWYLANGCDTHSIPRTFVGQAMKDLSIWLTGGKVDIRKDLPKKVAQPATSGKSKREKEFNSIFLRKAWSEGVQITEDSLAVKYLRNRGIKLDFNKIPFRSVRFHPALEYRIGNMVLGNFPAIMLLVTDAHTGKSATIHAHYLSEDGEKNTEVEVNKKSLPLAEDSMNGCAVWLYDFLESEKLGWDTLGFAEGYETTLACIELTSIPVIPTVNKTLLSKVNVPGWVKRVVIFADHDAEYIVTYDKETKKPIRVKFHRAGEMAAFDLKDKLEALGLKVYIYTPPNEKEDFLDLKNRLEKEGIPFVLKDYRLLERPVEDEEKTNALKLELGIV